jgi:phenylalanyl-tRNA synthetase beta subunit
MNRLNMPLLSSEARPEEGGVKIFEIGTVFKNNTEVIHVGYADKKEVTEVTLSDFSAKVLPSGEHGYFSAEKFLRLAPSSSEVSPEGSTFSEASFTVWSIYPFVTRDIAVWVPEGTTPETLSEIYEEFGAEILRGKPTLFDQFTKNGRTSYAFRLVFQAYDRTLVDDEVNVIMGHINEKITALGYEAR